MIALVTDSTCDLPGELIRAHHIHVVSQNIIWGTESYRDGIDIDNQTFYRRLAQSRDMPRTAQPSPADFLTAYRTVQETMGASEILCVTLGQKLSGTHSSALQAAGQVDCKVRVVDSQSVSMGIGFLVLKAAEMRDQGTPLEKIARNLEERRANIDVFFTLATLDYLYHGGRIGKASHLFGSILQISPILHTDEGEIAPLERVRTRRKALDRIIELVQDQLAGCPVKRVAVLNGQAQEEANQVYRKVQTMLAPEYFYQTSVCPTIGVHAGPGVVGLVYDRSGD